MNIILVLAVVIIVAVLMLSTKAYLQIPVLLITFGVAAVLNMGTNYWFGTISSVTNSIAVVLQLALAIDYAIILCDRFMEEHETLDAEEAVKVALSKAIPEISSSSRYHDFRHGCDDVYAVPAGLRYGYHSGKSNHTQPDFRFLLNAGRAFDFCKRN